MGDRCPHCGKDLEFTPIEELLRHTKSAAKRVRTERERTGKYPSEKVVLKWESWRDALVKLIEGYNC